MTAPLSVRLFKPEGPDRVAAVSVLPSYAHAGLLLISVAVGPSRPKLRPATLHGPFEADAAAARFAEIVAALRAEGFVRPGLHAALADLASPSSRKRALAAIRLGWMREPAAVDLLLALAEKNGEEICSVIDALGAIGDPRGIPPARREAARKLLSRRRSGSEALRNLGDAEGEAAAMARLPEAVRALLRDHSAAEVAGAVADTPLKDRGLAIDTLYDLATPATVAASRKALEAVEIERPHIWRYAKSVFKRSMLRHDAATFGWLAHRIERVGRTADATRAELKSGLDGQTRMTTVFSRRTRDHVRRLSWRYLRRLAVYRPEAYALTAAEAIVHYEASDESDPYGDFGAYADCYLLHRVLWSGGTRYELVHSSLRFRRKPGEPVEPRPGVREEMFPELWDAQPRAYLRLLAGSRLIVVQEFALRAVLERHVDVLQSAPHAEVIALLAAAYEPTSEAGLNELRRRFDPANPDWPLLALLLADERQLTRAIGIEWLRETAALWSHDPDRCAEFLIARHADVREAAAALCIDGLSGAPAGVRQLIARRVLELLKNDEREPGEQEALAAVARAALLDELMPLVETSELASWLESGSVARKSVAAALLSRRGGEALAALGLERIATLARDEMAAVRAAAIALLALALPRFAEDPSLLLEIAESEWADSRRGAVELLRSIHPDLFALDAVLEMLDSSSEEVEELARELLDRTRGRWDPVAVLSRLLEHPRAAMRRFVIEEIQLHLMGDLTRLESPRLFFRTVLFDLKPSAAVKRKAIELLAQNGERDEEMARLAVDVLGSIVRTETREDFEDALAALARIKLAFPGIEMPAGVLVEGPA